MFSRLAFVAAAASLASAQLEVLIPGGPDHWWVANSVNNLAWNCQQSQVSTFSVFLANQDVKVLSGQQGLISVQNNFTCSQLISADLSNHTATTGYTILLTNVLNQTDVLAQSQPFEIKPEGSAYPATTTAGGESTGSSTASGGAQTSTGASLPLAVPSGALGAFMSGILALLAL